MGRPPDNLDVEAQPFMDNPLVVIAAAEHPLTKRRRIPLRRLKDQTFLMREQGSGTRIAVERFLADKGMTLSKWYRDDQ